MHTYTLHLFISTAAALIGHPINKVTILLHMAAVQEHGFRYSTPVLGFCLARLTCALYE